MGAASKMAFSFSRIAEAADLRNAIIDLDPSQRKRRSILSS
jgi:hypothetical protein